MPDRASATPCHFCGLAVRQDDDTIDIGGEHVHATCAATLPDDGGAVASVRRIAMKGWYHLAGTYPDTPTAVDVGGGRLRLRSPVSLASCRLMAAGLVMIGVVGTLAGPGPHPGFADYTFLWVLILIPFVVVLRATRVRIELSPLGVDIFRVFTTTHLAWPEIAGVSLGYAGLQLCTHDGRLVTCGPGKSNWSKLAGMRTNADEWLTVMQEAIDDHRGE